MCDACVLVCVQHRELQLCVSAAGAKCQLISSAHSVSLDALEDDSAVVLAAPPLNDLPKASVAWVSEVQQNLGR